MSSDLLTTDDVLSISDDELLDIDDVFDIDDDTDDDVIDIDEIERQQAAMLATATREARRDIRDIRDTMAAAGRDLVDEYHAAGSAAEMKMWDARAAVLGMGKNWQDNYERRARDRERRADAAARNRDAVKAVKVSQPAAPESASTEVSQPAAPREIKIHRAPETVKIAAVKPRKVARKSTFARSVDMSNLAAMASKLQPAGRRNQARIDSYNRGGPGRYA